MSSAVGPGIANVTSTRIETAARHHLAVRVDFEHMLSWVGYDQTVLQKEKMNWCMHKDDLVIGCSRPVRANEPSRAGVRNKAYPSVVVTLAKMEPEAVNYLVALYHNCRTFRERDQFVVAVERASDRWCGTGRGGGKREIALKQIQEMPEFYFLGVSVGVAYAHPNSGDNVASAMIGGLVTIMNGAFAIQGGDYVQWYWEAERPCFQANGLRWPELIGGPAGQVTSDDVVTWLGSHRTDPSRQEEKRRKFYDRGNGNFSTAYDGVITGKQQVAYPKPFRFQDDQERVADRMRVFGRALSSARAFEMVDVMVCRQSL